MDSNTWTALAGLAGVIVTAILAPIVTDKLKARAERVKKVSTDQATLAKRLDERVDKLLAEYDRLRDEAEQRLAERDRRIDNLEREVEELRREVIAYRLGLAAPKGYVVVPLPLWEDVRARLGDVIHGTYTGEDRRSLPPDPEPGTEP